MKNIALAVLVLISYSTIAQVKVDASFGGEYRTGNYKSYTVNFTGNIRNDSSKIQWAILPNYRYTTQSSLYQNTLKMYENELYVDGSLEKKFPNKSKIIAFSEYENSYTKRIDNRISFGIGFGKTLLDQKGMYISVTEVFLPEIFQVLGHDNYDRNTLRLSTRLKMSYNLLIDSNGKSKRYVRLNSITLFQPSVINIPKLNLEDNSIFRSTNSLYVDIVSKISVGIIYTYTFDSYPYYVFVKSLNDDEISPVRKTSVLLASLKYRF